MVYAIGAALSGFGNRFKMTDNLKATMAVIELNQMSVGVHGVELKAVDGSLLNLIPLYVSGQVSTSV